MATIEFNWQPSERQLRQFAGISLVALPLIAYLFTGSPGFASWQLLHTMVIGGATALGLLLVMLSWIKPSAVRPVFISACLLAFPIGLVIGELVLIVIFLLIFTPVAILFRIIRRDALERELRPDLASYWQEKRAPKGMRSYFRQS